MSSHREQQQAQEASQMSQQSQNSGISGRGAAGKKQVSFVRETSFADIMGSPHRADHVESWLKSIGDTPSLRKASSIFLKQLQSESSKWVERTESIELSNQDIPPYIEERTGSVTNGTSLRNSQSLSFFATPPHMDMFGGDDDEDGGTQDPSLPVALLLATATQDSSKKASKALTWIYSSVGNKLFTHVNEVFPLEMKTLRRVPEGSSLEFHLEYIQHQERSTPVRRCPRHSAKDKSENRHFVLQAPNPKAVYQITPKGTASITIPAVTSQDGLLCHAALLRMTCYSSCIGGMNRRDVQIVASLMSPGGLVLGQLKVPLRVCACPVRDCKIYESTLKKHKSATAKDAQTPPVPLGGRKPSSVFRRGVSTICKDSGDSNHDLEMFKLEVKGDADYFVVKKIAEALTTSKAMEPIVKATRGTVVPDNIVTSRSVHEFLARLSLPHLERTFLDKGYDDLEVIEQLDIEDMKMLGVTDTLIQDKILTAAAKLARLSSAPYRHNLVRQPPKSRLIRVLVNTRHGDSDEDAAGDDGRDDGEHSEADADGDASQAEELARKKAKHTQQQQPTSSTATKTKTKPIAKTPTKKGGGRRGRKRKGEASPLSQNSQTVAPSGQ